MMAILNTSVIYHGILTLENVSTAVNYHGIFITLAPGACTMKLLRLQFTDFHNKLECLLPIKSLFVATKWWLILLCNVVFY
jgi:hypothetical protein